MYLLIYLIYQCETKIENGLYILHPYSSLTFKDEQKAIDHFNSIKSSYYSDDSNIIERENIVVSYYHATAKVMYRSINNTNKIYWFSSPRNDNVGNGDDKIVFNKPMIYTNIDAVLHAINFQLTVVDRDLDSSQHNSIYYSPEIICNKIQ